MNPVELPTTNAVKDGLVQPIVSSDPHPIIIDPEGEDQNDASRDENGEKDRKRNVEHCRIVPLPPKGATAPGYFFSEPDSSEVASADSSAVASVAGASADSAAGASSSVDSSAEASAFLEERRERLRVFLGLV